MLEIEYEHTTTSTSRLTALATLRHAGKLVAATEDSRIAVWHNDAAPIDVLVKHPAPLRAIAPFSLKGADELAIGDDDGCVSLVRPLQALGRADPLPGRHVGPIHALGTLPMKNDCLIASAGDDGLVKTRCALSLDHHTLAGCHASRITSMCPAGGSGLLITASEDGNVLYWDPIGRRAVIDVIEVGRPLTALCTFSKRGALWVAAGSDGGEVVLWQFRSPNHRVSLHGTNSSPIVSLAWISDSPFPVIAVLSAAGTMEIWSISNETCVGRAQLGDHGVAVVEPMGRASVAAAYDASWSTMSWDLDLYVLDLESPGRDY